MFNESHKKISSLQNPLIKHLVKIRENARYRNEVKSLLISSSKVFHELIKITIPKRVFFIEGFSFPELNCEQIEVTEEVLKKITHLPSPEKVAAEFPYPLPSSLEESKKILALDGLSDPGNVGTLLRTSLAFGWDGIFFLPNTVDPFHEKVLSASRGALFKMPWKQGSWQELNNLKEKAQLKGFVADLKGKNLADVNSSQNHILLLSSEAQGVSKEGERFGEKITIPMLDTMESLNVASAGAILMYGLTHV